jgi:hypothetical protein
VAALTNIASDKYPLIPAVRRNGSERFRIGGKDQEAWPRLDTQPWFREFLLAQSNLGLGSNPISSPGVLRALEDMISRDSR